MKTILVSSVRYLIFFLVGILLLWLALRGINLAQIWNVIKNAYYLWILLALVPGFISHVSRAMRWNIMIEALGHKTNTWSTFYAVMTGYFANMAVPRLGEITRCTVLSRSDHIPMNRLIGTVIAERLFDLITLVVIMILVILSQFGLLRGFLERMVVEPVSERMSGSVWLMLLFAAGLLITLFLFWLLLRFSMPFIRKLSFYKKMKDLLLGFVSGIKSIKNLPNKKAFMMHTVIIWAMYFFMAYIPFRALAATSHLALADAATLLMMGSLAMVMPVPAGIGAYHWIVTKTLIEVFHIPAEPAASFALISHAAQLFFIILITFIAFALIITRKKPKPHVNP